MKITKNFIVAFVMIAMTASAVLAQVKIGTNPTTIDATANLEVEASTAGRKTSIDKNTGKLTLKDGSQANDYLLTSDANGVATWKPKASLRLEETIFIGEQQGTKVITQFIVNQFDNPKDRIPLVARPGSLGGYDPVTMKYVIQESGYYRVYAGARFVGTLPDGQARTSAVLYLSPWNVLHKYDNINTVTGPVLSVYWQAYLNAGETVGLYGTAVPEVAGGLAQNIIADQGFLCVVKLF